MDATELQQNLAALRPRLVRFARLQLRDDTLAEDAVQDAMLAAVENAGKFAGASGVATWVFAILKNKILDEFRRRARHPESSTADGAALDELIDSLYDEHGHWQTPPAAWADPEASFEQKRFWEVFEACIGGLPEKAGRVFGMRELLGMETEAICKEMKITTSNCWVLLHRARLGLRECLSVRWFGET